MKLLTFIALIICALSVSADKARFDNYRVYSISVKNELQLKVLKELYESSDSVSLRKDFVSFTFLLLSSTTSGNLQPGSDLKWI